MKVTIHDQRTVTIVGDGDDGDDMYAALRQERHTLHIDGWYCLETSIDHVGRTGYIATIKAKKSVKP